jgi:hypothetical protein
MGIKRQIECQSTTIWPTYIYLRHLEYFTLDINISAGSNMTQATVEKVSMIQESSNQRKEKLKSRFRDQLSATSKWRTTYLTLQGTLSPYLGR